MSEISFCDTDPGRIEKAVIESYESLSGRTLYPADPVKVLLQGLAYVIAQQRAVINETGRQNLLRYAAGPNLDALGALTGTKRIPAAPAVTTVRFTRSAGSSVSIFIKAGTRITADGKIYFRTKNDAVIPSGSESADALCEAAEAGAAGNGCEPGALSKIVDPVAYVASAENLSVSSGGSDEESDDALRERIYIAPERFSVAGPVLAYQYHAKSSHADITDTAVLSPEGRPGDVVIYPLMKGGELPSDEILALVKTAVSNEKVRPLTDNVFVEKPEAEPYDINIRCYFYEDSGLTPEDVNKAVDGYVLWQKSKLGRNINPDRLRADLFSLGVKRVDVASPVFKELKDFQVALCQSCSVSIGKPENE